MVKILVATPVLDGLLTAEYTGSILGLVEAFAKRRPHVHFEHRYLASSLVTRARNAYATYILEDKSFSHLLFIDADMGFGVKAIEKLIDFDGDIVGYFYPKRGLNYERHHSIARQVEDPVKARNIAHDYVATDQLAYKITEKDGVTKRELIRKRGFLRTARLGTGLMLIRRKVFESVADRFPELHGPAGELGYKSMGVKGRVFQCFEPVQLSNGLYLSEDLAFCHRWVEGCKGEIWGCADETITHVGRTAFHGRFIDRYEAKL
ncbi:MAG TPA: hypothetical protein VGU24_03220 [Microvirga sp.]|jgi:hypothetical protein|nr:hypothetical protein [Microvirga sp.]